MISNWLYVYLRLLLPVLILYSQVSSTTINLYTDTKFKGAKLQIEVDQNNLQCVNLPESEIWQKKVSSIDTNGLCLDIYAEGNCTGERKIRLYNGNNYHDHLSVWDFNDKLTSLQACDKVINRHNYEREGDTVTIWNSEGRKLNLNVPSCKNLPMFWSNRTTSARTYSRCYNFYSGQNCTGTKIHLNRYNENENFEKWNFSTMTNSIEPGPCTGPKKLSTLLNDSPYTENQGINWKLQDAGLRSEIIILVSLVVIGGIIVLSIYYRRRSKNNTPLTMDEMSSSNLSKTYIDNFMHGNPAAIEAGNNENEDAIYIAENMPYDAATYEIPLESLDINWQIPLGSGQYGTVLKAKVTNSKFPEPFFAAVKTVKAGSDPEYVKALLGELKIMMYLNESNYYNQQSQRKHTVNLIGACTQNLSKLEPYIILELCTNGSLLNYLRNQRTTFVNYVRESQLETSNNVNSKAINGSPPITTTYDLLRWSHDIANGMEFLSRKKVIHGDLAARNVLLTDEFTVKITDFGLSRQLYQYTQYVKKQQEPLPWRWMAIESLKDMNFSTKSDVWAFGVTLNEIFTLGEMPYPGIMFNPQFLTNLKNGYRMDHPQYAPVIVYDIMKKCWEEMPEERPSFSEIRENLFNILDAQVYTTMS